MFSVPFENVNRKLIKSSNYYDINDCSYIGTVFWSVRAGKKSDRNFVARDANKLQSN